MNSLEQYKNMNPEDINYKKWWLGVILIFVISPLVFYYLSFLFIISLFLGVWVLSSSVDLKDKE